MNLNEMTYGVELEITIPAGAIQVGGYHSGRDIPGFPAGWKAQADGSIQTPISGHVGAEIVSPILRGPDGLMQIADVVRKLNAMGARINVSCGFHVHVGFPRQYLPRLGHLVYMVANVEGALFAMTGTRNREANQYCRSIKAGSALRTLNYEACQDSVAGLTAPYTDSATGTMVRPMESASMNRYHTLNITNLVRGAKPTVEFRVFQGTLNLHKIVAFVRVSLGLVQKATQSRRKVAWDLAGRGGVGGDASTPLTGKEQVTRLFYRLGWNRGSTAAVYGMLEAPGIGGMDESKAIIQKMAEKYDTRR